MKKMIELLNLTYKSYERCIEYDASMGIKGPILIRIKKICHDIIDNIDDIIKNS